MGYIIDVEKGSDKGSIVADVGFRYNINLNQINEAEIKISGTGSNRRGLLSIGAVVYIYKDGTLNFKGLIDTVDYYVGGTVSFHVSGFEVWLAKENGSYTNSPWLSTASASIFSNILGDSSYFTAGTINTGFDTDYRLITSSSIWNGLSNLAKKTTQDININYTSSTISILNHVGSTTSVAVFNQGKEITNVRKSVGYPLGNKIIVYGKGDGENQITGTASDATSIGIYGTVTKPVIDKSIISESEANKLADAELALNKDPPTIYDLDLTNPEYAGISLGDVITLNALDQDVNNEEVRIVGIEEGERAGIQYKSIQVTNPELKTLMRTKSKVLAMIQKQQIDQNSYMQGSGNTLTWGRGLNADSSFALKLPFYVPSSFVDDEANNIRINSMTIDYDVDPFNTQYGGASFDGTDPQVQNSSANTEPEVSGTSGSTAPGVSGSSGVLAPDVENYSGDQDPDLDAGDSSLAWIGGSLGSDSDSSQACSSGSWTTIVSVSTDGTGNGLYVNFELHGVSGGAEDIQIKVKNSGTLTTNDAVWGTYIDGFRDDSFVEQGGIYAGGDGSADYITLQVYPFTGAINVGGYISVYEASHEHSFGDYQVEDHYHYSGAYGCASHGHAYGTYAAANHTHADGTYAAGDHDHDDGSYDINAADLDHISIGDDVGEAASVNATSVSLYLDFLDAGSWVNKHSIITTGATLGTEVDITNSGVYPDVSGYWRVRVLPNSATPDFVQAIVNIKHNLDS